VHDRDRPTGLGKTLTVVLARLWRRRFIKGVLVALRAFCISAADQRRLHVRHPQAIQERPPALPPLGASNSVRLEASTLSG
jgi:hypothetical protein